MNEKNRDYFTFSITDMEPDTRNALLGAKKVKRLDSQCSIHVHSLRYRLTDTDGVSAKAVIDGIVKTGLLADDSSEQVKKITFSQEKIPKSESEKTIITIYEV